MGGLVAALGTTARPALDRAALAHRGGSAGALEHGHGAIAAVARAGGACVERSDGALAAVDGRLDDRDGLSAAVGCRGSDAALVLGAWRRWGPALVDHVRGDLALVVVTRDGLLAARPPCATRPLFAARTADGWFAATELAALPAEARSTVDEARVAGWLIRDFREDTRTFFAAARRVPPGAALWWTARGEQWRRAALADVPEPADPVAAVREALERSVERRLQGAGPTAALVSGGLDSSTVGALAARRGVTDALCATFDGYPEADERSYARQASAAAGLTLRELPAAGLGQLSDAAAALSQADEPPDLSHLAMHAALIDGAAALGATTLLTGTGGDYVASHGHARLTELARRGRIDLALAEIRALVRAGYPGTARDWLTTWVLRPAVPERALALRRRLTGADAVRRPAEWIRHDFANAHDLPSRVRTAWQQWTRAAPDALT